jgi:hypothetical protein
MDNERFESLRFERSGNSVAVFRFGIDKYFARFDLARDESFDEAIERFFSAHEVNRSPDCSCFNDPELVAKNEYCPACKEAMAS